jgi:hypothetical protein
MYVACGFRETGRHLRDGDPPVNVIDYQIDLSDQEEQAVPEVVCTTECPGHLEAVVVVANSPLART